MSHWIINSLASKICLWTYGLAMESEVHAYIRRLKYQYYTIKLNFCIILTFWSSLPCARRQDSAISRFNNTQMPARGIKILFTNSLKLRV